jgi:hypothetical protein
MTAASDVQYPRQVVIDVGPVCCSLVSGSGFKKLLRIAKHPSIYSVGTRIILVSVSAPFGPTTWCNLIPIVRTKNMGCSLCQRGPFATRTEGAILLYRAANRSLGGIQTVRV